jgi:MtrB/PioB family decaheme-associated outer membrane protein
MLYVLILVTAPILDAFAEETKRGAPEAEPKKVELEAGVTGTYPAVRGNQAKYSEYRDIRGGTLGAYGLIYFDFDDQTGNFVKFNALNMGYDDQYYRLDGGKRGSFKYFLFYNETPHNIGFDGITPYTGAGSSTLAYGGPGAASANPSTWLPFAYSTKRKEYGGGAKVTLLKPFFFDVSFSQEKKTGTKPSGAEGAVAAFGRAIELPQPVDYQTDQVKAEAGYARQPFFLSLSYAYSQFKNNNDFLNFRNPFLVTQPNVDTLTLPPDNSFHRAGLTGSAKLPYNSKLNTNLSYSMARSDQNFLSTIWDAGVRTPVTLSSNRFYGDVRTQNYDFVFTSRPVSFAEGKLFYKYYDRDNKSDTVVATAGGATTVNTLFTYKKQYFGAEVDFSLQKNLHLVTGYKHVNLDRKRNDIPKNQDDVYSAELRWSPLKMGILKVGYEKLVRSAEFRPQGLAGDELVELYMRRFDAAPAIRETFKASANFSPLDELSFTLGYKYKKTSYTATLLGLQNDERTEFSFDVDYAVGEFARLFGYFDYDERKFTEFQRRYAAGANPNPFGIQNATNFNWQSDQTDKTFDFGIATDIYVVPRVLTLRLSADYLRSHGTNDFTYFTNAALTGGRNNDNIDIGNWGSYKKEFYMVKVLYNVTPSTSLTAGYAYEKYSVSDAQYDGYRYTLGTPPTTYLTGAYANPDYKANVVFFGVNYKFQ